MSEEEAKSVSSAELESSVVPSFEWCPKFSKELSGVSCMYKLRDAVEWIDTEVKGGKTIVGRNLTKDIALSDM